MYMEIIPILLIIAFLIILFLIFLLLLPLIRKQRSKTPDNTAEIHTVPHPFTFKNNPADPLNERVVEVINRMGAVGDEAESKYQNSLIALRPNAERIVSIVSAEYKNLNERQYLDRWSLIHLLSELKHSSSLAILDEILSSRVPPERSKNPSSFSTVGEEIIIRTTAVEAITRLGAEGNAEALRLLLKHSKHENFSVKRACVQGFLAHGGKDARERIMKELPENDRYILNIKREDIKNIPQPKIGKYTKDSNGHDAPKMPPPFKS
jgi:hypothetical protein